MALLLLWDALLSQGDYAAVGNGLFNLLAKREAVCGAYYALMQELRLDDEILQKYFWYDLEQFSKLLDEITVLRQFSEVLCPRHRLAIVCIG